MHSKKNLTCSRRDFLKATTAGTALAYVGTTVGSHFFGGGKAFGQSASDPFRVVQIHNTGMSSGVAANWSGQNALINDALVRSSLEQALMALTDATNVQTAWTRIVPNTPSYDKAAVAIKFNYINSNLAPHAAIVAWVIQGLRNLGIPAGNIYVYDERSLPDLTDALGSPSGIHIGNPGRSGSYSFGSFSTPLSSIIHEDAVNWIINLCVPKQHDSDWGGFTMSMKNHFGSFNPGHGAPTEYLASINAHPKIQDKTILNILDAIWGSDNGSCCGSVSDWFNKIFMSRKSLALDYWAAKQLLEPDKSLAGKANNGGMGLNINWNRVNAWPSEGNFGITLANLQNSSHFIDVPFASNPDGGVIVPPEDAGTVTPTADGGGTTASSSNDAVGGQCGCSSTSGGLSMVALLALGLAQSLRRRE